MIAHRVKGLTLLHYVWQCAGGVILFWIWLLTLTFGIRVDSHVHHFDRYVVYSVVFSLGFALNLFRSKIGNVNVLQLTVLSNHRLSLTQTVTILVTLLVFLFAARDEAMSRVFLFSFAPVLYVYLYFTNKYLPPFLAKFIFKGDRQYRTVLLGSRRNSSRMSDWLRRKENYGLETVGLITDEQFGCDDDTLPILGAFGDLEQILTESRAAQLVVLEMPDSLNGVAVLSDVCDRLGVRLLIVNDMEEKLSRSISFIRDEGFSFMCLRSEPLESPINRTVKRAVDIAIAFPVVIFVLPPVSLAVWLVQQFQSPGPLFFKQRRSGMRGSEFEILKFRTMHVDNDDEARQAAEGDSRIYPWGHLLRKLSIDEFPQFLNVMRGEMSIVGPRPHFIDHDILFGEIARYYRLRSFIKPGITGLAQVRGLRGEARREKDLLDRIQSDLYYLENWSIILDWYIILKTAYQVVKPPKTAY